MSAPIIRLDIERMKFSVVSMLQEYAAQMDSDIKAAVDEYCTEENLGRLIREAAKEAIGQAVKEEIQRAFSYSSNGRKAIREAIEEMMDDQFPIIKKAKK